MRVEDSEYFSSKFGEATKRTPVPAKKPEKMAQQTTRSAIEILGARRLVRICQWALLHS